MVREYQPGDLAALVEMHRKMEMTYDFPDLDGAQFFSKLVLENGRGRPEMALAARLTAEMFLLMDPEAGTPAERWQHFQELHRAAERDVAEKGLRDAHAWLPPGMEKRFGKRLLRLGWVRDDRWVPFVKYLEVPSG